MTTKLTITFALVALTVVSEAANAGVSRVLGPGELPKDNRLQPLKDLDGYFPFHPPKTNEAWNKRAEYVRRRILVALGLWPMPTRTPLNPVIHGKIDRDEYTVEKVYFESYPGFYVTGSLYRPKQTQGRRPGVLCPHGHWANGRFYDQGPEEVRRQIVQGAERFEEGGRSPLQSRCVQLVKMGCVVFHYDMIGYADSQQIPAEIAHRFSKQRPEMNTIENWGLFSPQAEAHLQSVMGLQTWSSIRCLDFLTSLPDVDADRIAVTGASGGGTQTFILGAIDPRPAVIFPAVMVSTAMQGGCTCENACLLRIETGNVEFAALFAPKPLGMTAANDWTKEMETKGFPELKEHYKMVDSPDNVMLKALVHFEHNYNYVSRAAMYPWLNKHLKLGFKEPIVEEDYQRLTKEEMSVWDDQHPKPEGGPDFERRLLRWITEDSERQLAQASTSLEGFRKLVGGALDVIIGRTLSEAGEIAFREIKKREADGRMEVTGLLQNQTYGEEIPIILLRPAQWRGQTVVWIDTHGKSGLYDQDGLLKPAIRSLIDAGIEVVGIDLLYQGAFLEDGKPVTQTRRVKNEREFAGYTFGYNHPLFAQQVHDILSLIKYLRMREPKPNNLTLIGLNGAGHWVAAARAQAREQVDGAVVDTRGFRFAKIRDIRDVDFLPGGAKYGDLPGIIALGAPGKLLLAGEADGGPIRAIYETAGATENLSVFNAESADWINIITQWILKARKR
ncbi:MAG: acetylxylan esterase [Planctomycetes bacterium RBG_16_55_9]|nr:MAG: acetylxylan esterase [Planctomycetes bacterium RBG_16_55_9]